MEITVIVVIILFVLIIIIALSQEECAAFSFSSTHQDTRAEIQRISADAQRSAQALSDDFIQKVIYLLNMKRR